MFLNSRPITCSGTWVIGIEWLIIVLVCSDLMSLVSMSIVVLISFAVVMISITINHGVAGLTWS